MVSCSSFNESYRCGIISGILYDVIYRYDYYKWIIPNFLWPYLIFISVLGLAIVYRESVKKAITNPIILLLLALAFLGVSLTIMVWVAVNF
ncbi:hypothetical protein [Sulfurisphaera ohwakuensis]|uniref:hypothetical protein n=1 Tax=Sulfurisphaera ohwakuensis TaxID=69656 RepID=UPI0036F1991D